MDTSVSIRNRFLIYKLTSDDSLSISHIRRALGFIIQKHIILRTNILYDESRSIEQALSVPTPFPTLEMTHVMNNDHLDTILLSEKTDESLFNLKKGQIFRCHLLYHTPATESTNYLFENDIIIFNFHHAVVDDKSMRIFIDDFSRFLTASEIHSGDEDNNLRLNNTLNEIFDKSLNMKQCLDEALRRLASTSKTEQNVSNNTNFFSVTHAIDLDGVRCLRNIMSLSSMSFFESSLATFFAFIFKTSTSAKNLCTAVAVDSRIKYGFQDMVGPFTNIILYQVNLDPYETFVELCTRVKKVWSDAVIPYSHSNYQEILKKHQSSEKSPMRALFVVKSNEDYSVQSLNVANKFRLNLIERSPAEDDYSDIDIIFTFTENEQDGIFSFNVKGALAVYEQSEIVVMAQRLHNLFGQLSCNTPLYQLSVLLPQEAESIQLLKSRLETEHVQSLIGDTFMQQAIAHPQKVSIMLDEQCISYGELLYRAQYLAQHLITNCRVKEGDIVTQYVNRSIEMVIGILGILLAGATYCPLSPDQPIDRVLKLVQETQSRCTLAHSMTASVLPFSSVLIDSMAYADILEDGLFRTEASVKDVAYIIFTSGSTGTPKGVKISHENFGTCIRALKYLKIIANDRNVLQICSVTFDIHVLEILGTMWSGGSLVLLRPDNDRNVRYIISVIQEKEISTIFTVPTMIAAIAECLQACDEIDRTCLSTLRVIGSGGEPLFPSLVDKTIPLLSLRTAFYNFYGPAECTPISSAYMVCDSKSTAHSIPIGLPIPGYKFRILDEHLQFVIPGQVGELFIGGNGVFRGYLHQPELTKKFRVALDDDGIYYQTGDLVRYDVNNRTLYYVGRKDSQIKLRGQRIELGEIESILMKIVTRCAVIKTMYNDEEHLVAYVEPKISASILRHHCTTYLPLYMVPSLFLTFDKIAINQNGKIDWKALPPPDFSRLSLSSDAQEESLTEMEQRLGTIWCQILAHLKVIPPKSVSFFSLGGNSLSLMRLYQKYQAEFPIYTTRLTFHELFHQATIAGHARLLINEEMLENKRHLHHYAANVVSEKQHRAPNAARKPIKPTQLIRGPLSTPQLNSISYLDIRSLTQVELANIANVYRISQGFVSVKRLRQALDQVILKQATLRTSYHIDTTTKEWYQQIEIPTDERYVFVESELNTENYDEFLDSLIARESLPGLFKMESPQRVRLHIVRQHFKGRNRKKSGTDENDQLQIGDVIILTLRHEAIDGLSFTILLNELAEAYKTGRLSFQPDRVTYLDYTIHERQANKSLSEAYWKEHHKNLDPARFTSAFPSDRPWIPNLPSVTPAHTVPSTLNTDIVSSLVSYATECEVTLATLCLASFCAFIYHMTNLWDEDIGITYTMNVGSSEPETVDLIGPFMYIPLLRMHLEDGSNTTFLSLVRWVHSVVANGYKHVKAANALPDNIDFDDLPANAASLFPEMFPCFGMQFDIEEHNHLALDDAGDVRLDQVKSSTDGFPQSAWWRRATNDYWNTLFHYDPLSNKIRYVNVLPTTLFEFPTAERLSLRFHSVLERIFGPHSTSSDRTFQPLAKWLEH